jgi:hypothetical protein
MEARRYYAMASAAAPGSPERSWLFQRAAATAPGTGLAARATEKLSEKRDRVGEPWEVEATWASIALWFGEAAPGPFPGRPQWFDGDPSNGEVFDPVVRLEGEGSEPESVLMTYAVRQGAGLDYLQEWLLLNAYPAEVGRWIRFQLAQRERLGNQAEQLGRPRIPYSIMGGVGLSGVDFYPRLRPIETREGELDLYETKLPGE